MASTGRIAHLGDSPPDWLAGVEPYSEDTPVEVLVVEEKRLSPQLLRRWEKTHVPPALVILHTDRFKYWRYLADRRMLLPPITLPQGASRTQAEKAISRALELHRSHKRLMALRGHHNRSWNFESDPALRLITDLVHDCTKAESVQDLLRAIESLRGVIEYQDATAVICDRKGNLITQLPNSFLDAGTNFSLPDEGVTLLRPGDPGAEPLHQITDEPWSAAIVTTLKLATTPQRKSTPFYAHFVLFRRDLFPFSDKDLWLLELAFGPLSLAWEKVVMLQAISRASKEWRATFDAITQPVTVINENFEIIKANTAFASLIGKNIKQIKGRRCHALLAGRRTPCPQCPAAKGSNLVFGARITGRNKKELLAWSYGIHLENERYNFQFYRDVSEESALASALIQSEKMAALGKLVSAIAHEINNPLAGILATSQLLLADAGALSEAAREDLDEIRQAATRSKKIIADLLGFTGDSAAESTDIDVRAAIQAALTFSKSALQYIRVHTDIPEKLPSRPGKSGQLQQILFNLITNAAHAMGEKGDLYLSAEALDGGKAKITIRDTGPGIPAARLATIFDPFHTSKAEGKGTGLGLSIVRNLVVRLGGQIRVESPAGQGTSFHIIL